ncbi:hypothetical protein AcW1_004869 [Taiwanofungus camphoratus]|nr:hypothetical protein AcW2_006121 [Antrodia cinnamomea]KAI0938013.1 hypothetical protein AcV7_003325 [Antrodia cinnamomea]KAI0940045.1 hypothetical protein AcV5_001258 [Antrodia cinnamomea]KAI0960329.1 hypothetical protein AcW1_004869 [Antrodia cinnamomea]
MVRFVEYEGVVPHLIASSVALMPDSFALKSTEQESSLSWFWKLFSRGSKEKTSPITIPKYTETREELNLAVALQYGTATGLPQLQSFIKDFVEKVYQPAYDDCSIMVHIGNTDGWSRVMQTLMNPGDCFLTEEWTYPSMLASSKPYGMFAIPVAMDKDGMSSTDLRKVLSEWDEKARGCKRPHVMYTVPVGQNPVGSTMGATRKKEIYDVCVEYDVVIVEDDPYFFLQQGVYVPKSERISQSALSTFNDAEWLASLDPSYLKFDYQGRVIRLDTFSKYIAPGSRLGWHTCNPIFAERLERQGETSAQAPCGFGQSLITKLLMTWKYDGYVRWLHGLAVQYKTRRDFFIDCLADEFHLESSPSDLGVWRGHDIYTAYARPSRQLLILEKGYGVKMFSFVPPTSGMFIWVVVHFENLPAIRSDPEESPEMQLWTKLAEAGLLIAPGFFFAADQENPPAPQGDGHFRISFSSADFNGLKKAAHIFGSVIHDFFKQ